VLFGGTWFSLLRSIVLVPLLVLLEVEGAPLDSLDFGIL
jgi:hypothetical protein